MTADILRIMTEAALAAGEVILEIYGNPIEAAQKSDGSPVTEADARAEAVILSMLAETGLPALAEESAAAGRIPDLGERFFIIDPLDGTKEFIKRNGEFTVNIALAENGRPVLGVVTAPALGKGYAGGSDGACSFDIIEGRMGPATPIGVNKAGPMRVVASRSHGHAALQPICEHFAVSDDVSVGSSLKFCLVASGEARFYPRFTPTCEWDTAAGQAVLEAAGGAVLTIDGAPLSYNKRQDNYLNPFFAAADDAELARRVAAKMRAVIKN